MIEPPRPRSLMWPVAAVSCGVLAFEIGLLRALLVASWHHFAFLVISIALLGFGASGTALCFLGGRLRRGDTPMFMLVLAAAVAMPASMQLVRFIPVTARFVPTLLLNNAASWVLFWIVLSVPFFLGATAIGLALMRHGDRAPSLYAASLVGSAVGAAAVTLAMHTVPVAWLGVAAGGVTLLGVATFLKRPLRVATVAVALVTVGAWLSAAPPELRVDSYKHLAYVQRLVDSGKASHVVSVRSPRGVVDVFEGAAFHDLPFLSGDEPPPPMLSIVIDGQAAGSLLRVDSAQDARVVDNTLMAAPYSFVAERPRVLLLGETGGANVWLGLRHNASTVAVVQGDAKLVRTLLGYLGSRGGSVMRHPGVEVHNDEPRHYLERTKVTYDLIQLCSLESWAIESGGIAGLTQNYLVTVEGLTRCIERLSDDGIIAVGRGIQLPPRDNPKLLSTVVAALHRTGVQEAERHVVIVRDYLAACTMIKRTPWTEADVAELRRVCDKRELTPVYFPGVRQDELNHPDWLPGPDDTGGDWLHYTATHLLSGDTDFQDAWAFDISAPTDDRPFFANTLKRASIASMQRAYGDLWLTRTELALLFVIVATIVIAVAGALLTIIPLGLVASIRRARRRGTTAIYFGCIGLAYLMLEMVMLSRLVHIVGDPVTAGAVTISGFLFFSGLGSLTVRRLDVHGRTTFLVLVVVIVAGALTLPAVGSAARIAATLPAWARTVLSLGLIAPLGFLMGFPMPAALKRLSLSESSLIPWAWGINGFASVLAAPLATAIAMAAGFRAAGLFALVFYAGAAAAWRWLPNRALPQSTQPGSGRVR